MAKRTKALRVGIVGELDESVASRIDTLPGKRRVCEFADLYESFEDLVEFRPKVLVLDGRIAREEDLGALRLLKRRLGPDLHLVLAVPADTTTDLASLARRANARVLTTPVSAAELAATIDLGPEADAPSTYLDITRGVADEIANPLMFALGHVQLLDATLGADDTTARDQIRAIRQGLERISATIDKVRDLASVHECRPPQEAVPLRALFELALDGVEIPDGLRVDVSDRARGVTLRGERALLARAFRGVLEVAAELHHAGASVACAVDTDGADVRVRLRVDGPVLRDWDASRSFAPYHLSRALRGTSHGLTLFLVQAIVHAHGGRALARRGRGGGVRIELLLVGAP